MANGPGNPRVLKAPYLLFMSANDFITGRSLALPTCQFCYWPNCHQPIMLKIRLAWLWWRHVWPVLPWLRVIWLVDLTCERHERKFCTRSFKITEMEKGRWSWISNCGEAFHTDSWLAEANPGHSDWDAILQALLPGPSTEYYLALAKRGCVPVVFGDHQNRSHTSFFQPDFFGILRCIDTDRCWHLLTKYCTAFLKFPQPVRDEIACVLGMLPAQNTGAWVAG